MIQFSQLSLRRGTRLLLDSVDLTLNPRQKMGLIGENGAGKSSLLALILGHLSPDAGSISIAANLTIAHLEQEIAALEQPALEYVIDGDVEFRRIEKALETATDGTEIGELHGAMAHIDGYTVRARAAQLMHGLNFKPEEQERLVRDFSGGWRMRLNLARTLMSRADVLLLDEPTNHLDLDAIVWLEDWLKNTSSAVLLISHDRDFLDNVATHIVHLHRKQLKTYTGNYSDFERQRVAELALQQAHYEKQERKRAHWQKFVDRFRAKASKAPQVQSRIKALARMETAEAIHADSPFHFSFKEMSLCSNPLLSLYNADIGYGDHKILRNIALSITTEHRIGLIGPNGAGKSTLIQCLSGALKPLSGDHFMNPALKIGYFAQHQLDSLDLHASPFTHIVRLSPRATEREIRGYLGGFGFSGDQALSSIEHFSGGEKTRLALALLIWEKPNLLLLDEPTNHLDLDMRHALVVALQSYQGAMIVVSHDRHLLRACTDSFWLVAHQKVEEFNGDLDAYETMLKNYRRAGTGANSTFGANAADNDHKEQRSKTNRVKKIEDMMLKLNADKQKIDTALANPGVYTDDQKQQLAKFTERQKKINQQLEDLEVEWFSLQP